MNNTLTLEEIVERSQSEQYAYPDVFTDNAGLDIVLPDEGLHATPTWGRRTENMKRKAVLEISSWIGISSNAIHFYGKIKIQGVSMEYDNQPGCSTMSFKIKDKYPLSGYLYELKLSRPITQQDKDRDKEARYEADIRFRGYRVGELTDRFDTEEEIIEFAKVVFKHRFRGDWDFRVKHCNSIREEEIEI